jgi:hypothetical protein
MNGQDCEQLTLFPADSPASRTAVLGKNSQKKMTDTYGLNSCGSLENFGQEPLWVKMLLASYLPYMTAFAPTWKKQATKHGRFVYRLTLSVRTMKDTGWLLLASPRASQDMKPIRKKSGGEKHHGESLVESIGNICPECIGQRINPRLSEWLMGFPEGWTDA